MSKDRHIIEDNVTIYTGAVIAGKLAVHKRTVIGANSVVMHDVPKNALVVGNRLRL